MILWISILLLQGATFSLAWGCGLEDVCRINGIPSRTVDSFSDFQVSIRCSDPDASSPSWYIRRYMNGNNSLDGLGAPLTQNNSFRQNGNELTIRQVNGFAEGTYHCGVDNDTIQAASLCLFVRGRPFFVLCPGEFEVCPRITQLIGRANENVLINTRVKFVDGGFCNKTKKILTLTVYKDDEKAYFCSNRRGTPSTQLCQSTEKYRVQQHQTCIEQNITLCKYDMILELVNFNAADKGIYDITVEFDEHNSNTVIGRGVLMQKVNLLSESFTTSSTANDITLPTTTTLPTITTTTLPESFTTSSTSFTANVTTLPTITTTCTTLPDIAKYGIGFLLGVCITIILETIIAVAVCCYLSNRNNKQDHETDGVIARIPEEK